jgi:hypothetical protein
VISYIGSKLYTRYQLRLQQSSHLDPTYATYIRSIEGTNSGEATRGGGFEPPLATRITPGIRTKPQRNFFGKGVGVPHYLASAYLKS